MKSRNLLPLSKHTEVSPETAAALRSARTASTRAQYARQIKSFSAWLGRPVLGADPVDVANYLAGPGTARSASWRGQCVAAIRACFGDAGMPSPTDHPGVARTLRGLRRQHPRAPRQAAPLTVEAIAAIEATACAPRVGPGGRRESRHRAECRGKIDIALVRVMRDALLRRSEAAALTWGDVHEHADGSGRLTLAGPTKTDPEATSPHVSLSLIHI